jgi:hypothetical protein
MALGTALNGSIMFSITARYVAFSGDEKGSSAANIGRTAMPDYRAYIMGTDGHIQNRVDMRCNDDVEALRLAKQLVDGHDVELWQLDRKVETLKHAGPIRHS